MNTADIGEDALLAVSAMQRTILDAGIAMCYRALDNTGDGQMGANRTLLFDVWCGNDQCQLEGWQLESMVDIDLIDVVAAIEEYGWCGCYGATMGNPFVIQLPADDGEMHLHGEAADTFLNQE